METQSTKFEIVSKTVQIVSVVAGVVLSVLSFNSARVREAEEARAKQVAESTARIREAEAREAEARRPFRELQQKLYLETLQTAAILSNPEMQSETALAQAKKRFRELYVVELSMVEDPAIEKAMIKMAETIDPALLSLTSVQAAAYQLAHSLRTAYLRVWSEGSK